MIKAFITDDEQIVIDGIRFIMGKDLQTDVEIVGTARSGGETIEKCMNMAPDLFFMDIQMLGINGLETIEYLRRQYQEARFIVVTAHEKFEYAKKAIELGVSHFVSKPINRSKLVEVTRDVISGIEKDRLSHKANRNNAAMLNKILPSLDYHLINSIIINSDFAGVLRRYHEIHEAPAETGYVGIVEVGNDLKLFDANNLKYHDDVQSHMTMAVKHHLNAVVGQLNGNRLVFMAYEKQTKLLHAKQAAVAALQKMLEDDFNLRTRIACGDNMDLEKLHASYQEAMLGLRMIEIGEHTIESRFTDHEPSHEFQDMENILGAIEDGNESDLDPLLKKYFSAIRLLGYDGIRNNVARLLLLAYGIAYMNRVQNNLMPLDYIKNIADSKDDRELIIWCESVIKGMAGKINRLKKDQRSKPMRTAEAYIMENYQQDLTLTDVAAHLAVTPQYFSKQFKISFGKTFIEFLTGLRIEKAKDLLDQGHQSIKEISYLVGYNDPNYFSRLFKKSVGVKPSEYKTSR